MKASSVWRWACHVSALVVATTLVACGSSDSNVDPPANTGTITGLVVSAVTGQPVAGATAAVGTLSATTGADGRFTLAAVPEGAAVVGISAPNHARNFANATVVTGQAAAVTTRLSALGTRQTYSAAAGATIGVPNSPAQVVLPAGGIVDGSGAAFTGTVTVELSPIDPALDPASMPGDMTTRVGSGALQSIESFGAMAVVLTDSAGNRLNLASGASSTVRIPLSTRSPAPPATVPLFYFDETTGLWVEEGTATLHGTAPNQYYEGTVTHFTYWNADRVIDTITVNGCVRDTSNAPVVGATVRSDGLDYSGTASTITNASGEFSVAMRRASLASIFAAIDSRFSNTVNAGPSETTITLENCLTMGNGTPVFVIQPASQSVTEGGFVVFQAIARGTAPLTYQWQRNGVDIAGATTSVLLVDPVSNEDHSAVYRAVATNAVGSANSAPATLTVAALPPVIGVQPQPQSVVVGRPATFSVQMLPQGAPLQFQWMRNNADIGGAILSSYTLPAAALSDNGASFSVRVTNSIGQVVSTAATLTVTALPVPPTIGQQPASVSVSVGQSAQFTVVATGSAPLRYEWRRGSTVIPEATGPTYTLTTTTLADNGAVFSVVVSNDAGSQTSASATLTVTEPPAGSGYYLVANAGASASGSIVFANGAQTFDSPALVAVNSTDAASGVVTVETAGAATVPFARVFETTLQNNQISNTRERYAFYFKNARLYRLDQVSDSGAPVGQPLSSITSGDVCGAWEGFPATPDDGLDTIQDFADASRSWVMLKGPGADNQCGNADDTVLAVRANMGSSDAAVTVPGEPLVEINGADGALTGVILRAGQILRRLDANFANPVDLHTLTGTGVMLDEFTFGNSLPGNWLFIDNGVLYGYELDGSGGAPKALVTFTDAERARSSQVRMATQGGMAYVVIFDGTASRIVRIDSSLNVMASGTGPANVMQVLASPTRLIFLEMELPSYRQTMSSQPLGGGTPTSLVTVPQSEGSIGYVERSGEILYFTRYSYQPDIGASQSLGIVATDGSNLQMLPNTTIVTSVMPTTALVQDVYDEGFYALIVAQGLTQDGMYAGSTLRAIEGSTRTTLQTYGTLPASPSPSVVYPSGMAPVHYGQPGLLNLFAVQSEGEITDLLFFDSDAAGIVRLTSSIAVPAGAKQRPMTRLDVTKAAPARPALPWAKTQKPSNPAAQRR
jgi:hypothetical protein